MTTAIIPCVRCGKKLKARAEYLGKKVRCTQCGYTLILDNPVLSDDEDIALAPLDDHEMREERKREREISREFEGGTYRLSRSPDDPSRE